MNLEAKVVSIYGNSIYESMKAERVNNSRNTGMVDE